MKLKKLFWQECTPYQLTPWWMGTAYYNSRKMVRICCPLGINTIVALLRYLWTLLLCPRLFLDPATQRDRMKPMQRELQRLRQENRGLKRQLDWVTGSLKTTEMQPHHVLTDPDSYTPTVHTDDRLNPLTTETHE